MAIHKNRWLLVVSIGLVLLFATACIRSTGDQAQSQQSSMFLTDTPTATPSDTPEPTEEPTVGDVAISLNETNTATPTETSTATNTPTETPTALAVAQADDEELPEPENQEQDTFVLTATQLVINATGTAGAPLTQTAEAVIGDTDTPVPTVDNSQPIVTATTGIVLTGGSCIHEVRAGETLFLLSRYYGLLVMDIASANGIVNPDLISLGQRLTIPGCGTTGALPPPTSTPSPTATSIVLFGTGGTDLGSGGGGTDPNVVTTTTCQAQHTVQQGETLFRISVQYGVTAQAIANRNGITNINVIDMFDVLCIPAS
ncbi:MAG: LysM peptidoglycan-binding domain-containing protein [Chloroflexota bacterium]